MKLRSFFSLIVFCFYAISLNATTVIPFDNLGHLAESSDEVLIVKVIDESFDALSFRSWNVSVQKSFKGKVRKNTILNLESMQLLSASSFTQIAGDIHLEIGSEYLIFLSQSETGAWRPMTLSYYLYKTFEMDNRAYFVPVKESLEIHLEGENNGIFVIDKSQFVNYLSQHNESSYASPWDDNNFISRKKLSNFYPELRAAPSHCTFLNSGGTGFRWDLFPDLPLEVYCDTEADNGYANSHNEVGNAIDDLASSYSGLNIVNEGVVGTNYNPNCSGGSAISGNFSSFSNSLNGGDNILIIFNDPCSQIPNLSGCSGTLAIGGSYASTPFNFHDGMNWYTSSKAYVVVNNGTGACLSANNYKKMLTHEMTHGLGLGHIASSNGVANMNPTCCKNISSLDIECVDYLYPGGSAPLSIEVTQVDVSCFGYCDGSLTVDNVNNGTAPYSYSWSNGGNTQTISNICAGNYTVTVTDNNSNSVSETFTILEPDDLTIFITTNNTTCGLNNGSAFAFPDGGETPYFYSWSNGSSNSSISNLSSGSYTLTVEDINNCFEFQTIFIGSSVAVTAVITTSDETAFNANDGTATCTPITGIAPFSYAWNNNETTQTIIGLAPGNYTVTITDVFDCTYIETINIMAYICPTLTIIASQLDASCNEYCDGLLIITNVTNGIPPFSYNWNNGATTSTINNLCEGTYNVTVTDSKNCSVSESYTIIEPLELFTNASSTDETGNNFNDGTATSNPINGIAPITYAWSTGETAQTIFGLPPGDYTITITDANGCYAEETVSVAAYICPELSIIIIQEDINCFDDCNGSLTVNSILNGTPPYTYNWSNGATNSFILDLCPNDYSVTITDAKNCSIIGNYSITEPDDLLSGSSFINTSCGLNNGTATVNPIGGIAPYNLNWSNGATTNTIDNLSAGDYTITIEDNNNCFVIETINITPSTLLSVNISATDETYNNSNDGTATSNPTGGITPYTYLWNNDETTQTITNLIPGYYLVLVTDANGCINEQDIIVEAFICPSLVIQSDFTNLSCYELCNGSITINEITNGIAPFSYNWSNGATNPTIINLCQDTFNITITDDSNCMISDTFYIFSPNELIANVSSTDESFYNANDGTANSNPMGGTNPYSYLWSNGATDQNLVDLTPGQYILTITDENDCSVEDTVFIAAYICPNLEIIDTVFDIDCYNNCNGMIIINSITNGIAPFTYTWSNGATSDTIDNLCDGVYDITVEDAKNCSIIDSFDITQPEELLANASSTDETNFNANNGTATCNPSGGIMDYIYAWSNGENTQMISGLSPGTYTVTVTDENACTSIDSISISSFECAGQSILITQNEITCFGLCDGSLQITAIDSSEAPYTYLWSNEDTTQIITGLCTGDYSVTVIDANNCNILGSYTITEPIILQSQATATDELSYNGNNGTAMSNPTGGTEAYTYIWNNGDTTQQIVNLTPNQYTVTVHDVNNCLSIDTVTVDSFICPSLFIASHYNDQSCFGICDGSITIDSVQNALIPLNFIWDNGDSSAMNNDLCFGSYNLIITDQSNCTIYDTFTLVQPDEITILVDSLENISSEGLGSIYVSINNSTNYLAEWSSSNGYTNTSEDIDNISEPGCYTLEIIDTITNCSIDTTICIEDLTAINIDSPLENAVNIYPNPTTGIFTLDFGDLYLFQASISLIDITGKKQKSFEKQRDEQILYFDIDHFSPGFYLIKIETKKGEHLYKKVILNK